MTSVMPRLQAQPEAATTRAASSALAAAAKIRRARTLRLITVMPQTRNRSDAPSQIETI
jgi:hypothetical protein